MVQHFSEGPRRKEKRKKRKVWDVWQHICIVASVNAYDIVVLGSSLVDTYPKVQSSNDHGGGISKFRQKCCFIFLFKKK